MEPGLPPENSKEGQNDRATNGAGEKGTEIGVKPKPKLPQIAKIVLVMDAGIIGTIILLAEFSATFGQLNQ